MLVNYYSVEASSLVQSLSFLAKNACPNVLLPLSAKKQHLIIVSVYLLSKSSKSEVFRFLLKLWLKILIEKESYELVSLVQICCFIYCRSRPPSQTASWQSEKGQTASWQSEKSQTASWQSEESQSGLWQSEESQTVSWQND